MLQEEFARLIYMYQQAAEGKEGSVKELFQKSLQFIEDLKQQLINGDEEDKKAAIRMMSELYQHMRNHTKSMSERSGVSEEEMAANAENPANFTPEQWQSMQESRQKLAQSGQELVKLLRPKESPSGEENSISPESLMSKPTPDKKEPKKKKSKRSDWMRS